MRKTYKRLGVMIATLGILLTCIAPFGVISWADETTNTSSVTVSDQQAGNSGQDNNGNSENNGNSNGNGNSDNKGSNNENGADNGNGNGNGNVDENAGENNGVGNPANSNNGGGSNGNDGSNDPVGNVPDLTLAPAGGSGPSNGNETGSSLSATGQGGTCSAIWASVTNSGSGNMAQATAWELYWSATGNPKPDVEGVGYIASGPLGPLASGESFTVNYDPALNPNGTNGNYIFRFLQEPGHPGQGDLWSEQVQLSGCYIYGSLKVVKTDEAQMPMSGITFYLDGTSYSAITGTDGIAIFSDLPPGNYTLKEGSHEGYISSIESGTGVVITANNQALAEVVNTRKTGITLTVNKVVAPESDTPDTTKFEFKLFSYDGVTPPDWMGEAVKSGSAGNGESLVWSGLAEGLYYLMENVPAEYVSSIGSGTSLGGILTTDSAITVTNTRKGVATAEIVVHKTDNAGAPMAGVTFELYLGDALQGTAVTDVTGYATFGKIIEGTYTVKEVVPDGYTTSHPDGRTAVFTREVGSDSIIISPASITLDFINTKTPVVGTTVGSIVISKKDNAGAPMADITFTLYGGENYAIAVGSGVTNAEGLLTFGNLPPGSYRAVETIPDGYTSDYPEGQTAVFSPIYDAQTLTGISPASITLFFVNTPDRKSVV